MNIISDENDAPDPGYSMIRRTRPQTAYPNPNPNPAVPTNNNNQQVLQDDTGAIYAVIDKTRKNRATVHVSQNVESDLERQLGNYNSNQQVYAQVNKHSRDGSASSSVYDNPVDYQATGARPKTRTWSKEENAYSNNTELKHKTAQKNPPSSHQSIPNADDPYSRIKEKEDPYAKVQDPDPYAQIKDTDPYSTVKDPNNPYSKIKDNDPPYSKVKDSDSAGYSRIKDVNNLVKSNSEEVAGYSSIKDITPGSSDPNYAVIPGDRIVPQSHEIRPDPNYDQIPPQTDNVSTLRVAHGYATEISAEDVADGNNNPNGMVHIGNHQVNQDFWSRREHLYEEITVDKEGEQQERSRGQQVTVLHSPQRRQQQQYSVYRLSTDL